MNFMLFSMALAADPPCTPISSEFYVEGEHFWVQWDEPVADVEEAQQVLEWAEVARSTYLDLGWPITDETILIRIEESPAGGGLCTTTEGDRGVITPVITLFSTEPGKTSENTTMHEVVHAFEYAYMGTYLDAITSWPWWVEGTASWLTTHADGDLLTWRLDVRDYIDTPWVGLHQTPVAYSDPDAAAFLYGTAFLAQYIEDEHGMEAVRKTWEYGSEHTGTPIYLPDAIEGAGIAWEPFWQDYLATLAVLDTPYGGDFASGTFIEKHVRDLPADGSPKNARQPQGMGVSIIHFAASVGLEGRSLDVSFSGDPEVTWMGVLVRTKGKGPGGRVKELVPLQIDDSGEGTASLAEFDGKREAYLVVSPQDMSLEPHDFTWTAELGGAPEVEKASESGCGCNTPGRTVAWLPLLLSLGVLRSRGR